MSIVVSVFSIYRQVCRTKKLVVWLIFLSSLLVVSGEIQAAEKHYEASDYFSRPYPSENLSQGIILIKIDQSYEMLERVYPTSHFDSQSDVGKVGYFAPNKHYQYDVSNQYFVEDLSEGNVNKGAWQGQFLNWLLMRQIDMARYLLIGGQTLSEPSMSGVPSIITFESSSDYALEVSDSKSRDFSPIPDGVQIHINNGKLKYQDKTLLLRLKTTSLEKGLLEILSDDLKVYFYAHKLIRAKGKEKQDLVFGDASKLPAFLKRWSAQGKNLNLNQDAASKALKDTLKKVKSLLSTDKRKRTEPSCQRYVHIHIGPNFNGINIDQNTPLLADCQPELNGRQELTVFSLLTRDLPELGKISDHHIFSFREKYPLVKAALLSLYNEQHAHSYQSTGADMDYFSDGSGVLYQSLSRYSLKKDDQEVNWLGDLVATLVDKQGRLRSDNGDKKLGSLTEDPLLSSCFDEKEKTLRFRFTIQPKAEERCHSLNYPYLEHDVGYLWRASDSLKQVSLLDMPRQKSSFQLNEPRRYVRTHLGHVEYDFAVDGGYPFEAEWFAVSSQNEASKLINYIRGLDQEGYRNRQIGKDHFLLGDSFHSSPLVVGRPASNYHLLYDDKSYQSFLKQYNHRRTRIFLAGNDGMLHSFNGGWFDPEFEQIRANPDHRSSLGLGQETWAFVPFSVLPFLKELSAKYYGISPAQHLNLLSQTPYVFDAKIFGSDGLKGQNDRLFRDPDGQESSRITHPEGWGTVMVVGLGKGGGHFSKPVNHNGKKKLLSFKPSYLVFDITDAQQAPKLLAELNIDKLGSTFGLPTVVNQETSNGQLEAYLVIGSGTELDPISMQELRTKNTAGAYIFDLKTIQSKNVQSHFIDLNEPASYVTGVSAADWNLDGVTNALYINTASHKTNRQKSSQFTGSLYRINLNGKLIGQTKLSAEKIIEVDAPLIDRPQLSLDGLNNRWLYISTGAGTSITRPDFWQEDNLYKNKIMGVKEYRDEQGNFSIDDAMKTNPPLMLGSLLDVSKVFVSAETGKLDGSWSIRPSLVENTASELEQRLMQFSESSEYIPGWLRRLDDHETANGASKLFGGVLTQPTYSINGQQCRLSVTSYLHRLRFTTGTAWFSGLVSDDKHVSATEIIKQTKSGVLGSKPITSAILQDGSHHTNLIQSLSNGATQSSIEGDRKQLKSGEVSWREL